MCQTIWLHISEREDGLARKKERHRAQEKTSLRSKFRLTGHFVTTSQCSWPLAGDSEAKQKYKQNESRGLAKKVRVF